MLRLRWTLGASAAARTGFELSATPREDLGSYRSGNCNFGKLQLGKIAFGVVVWDNACGKVPYSLFRFILGAGGCVSWPTGRGIFLSSDRQLIVWVNEEDHLRIISLNKGGDLPSVYSR